MDLVLPCSGMTEAMLTVGVTAEVIMMSITEVYLGKTQFPGLDISAIS